MLFPDAGDGILRIQVFPKPPRVLLDGIPVQRELCGLQGYALQRPVVRLEGKGLAETVRRLVVTHGGAEDVSGGAQGPDAGSVLPKAGRRGKRLVLAGQRLQEFAQQDVRLFQARFQI